jgi:hypothetical protein
MDDPMLVRFPPSDVLHSMDEGNRATLCGRPFGQADERVADSGVTCRECLRILSQERIWMN